MFRCHFCNQVTPPKTTRHSVVIETREKKYATRRKETKRRGFRDRDEPLQDRGGQGVEIIREVDACPACFAKQKDQPAAVINVPDVAVAEETVVEDVASQEATPQEAASPES